MKETEENQTARRSSIEFTLDQWPNSEGAKAGASLESWVKALCQKISAENDWYDAHRRNLHRGAISLRILALVFGLAAALLPFMKEAGAGTQNLAIQKGEHGTVAQQETSKPADVGSNSNGQTNWTQKINAAWSAIAGLIAGALVVLDQYLGCTTNWSRAVMIQLQLAALWDEVHLWAATEYATLASGSGDPDNKESRDGVVSKAALEKIAGFAARVSEIAMKDTTTWSAEMFAAVDKIGQLADRKK